MGWKHENNIMEIWCDGPKCNHNIIRPTMTDTTVIVHQICNDRSWIDCRVEETRAQFCSTQCRRNKEAEFS